MAETDGLTELAKMFRERDPKTVPSITTGIVEALPPNPVIRLTSELAPGKTQLVFASKLIDVLDVDTTMQRADILKINDEVIVIPVVDSQMYYVIDKAVKFE